MFTNFRNKTLGFGVGILVSSVQKNVFRDDLSHEHLEIIRNKRQIQGKKTLVGDIISTFHLEMKITAPYIF